LIDKCYVHSNTVITGDIEPISKHEAGSCNPTVFDSVVLDGANM